MELNQIKTGLKAAHKIMDRWQATDQQKSAVLLLKPDELEEESLAEDELRELGLRVSYILNIYGTCRTLFSNIQNQDHYVRAKHKFFDGESMLSTMATGEIEDLERVFKYCMGVLHN